MSWTEIPNVDVNANPEGMWTWAHDWIEGPALIKFEADGHWLYSQGSKECTADGDLNALISPRGCLMTDAPVGALLAKIGGSTAGAKDGKIYLVGRKAIIQIDQNTSGPVLLSINDELTGMSDNVGKITVKIGIKKLPSPLPSPPIVQQPVSQPQPGSPIGPTPGPMPIPGAPPGSLPIPSSHP